MPNTNIIRRIVGCVQSASSIEQTASMIFDSETYYLSSTGFPLSSISGSTKKTLVFQIKNTSALPANMTLVSMWRVSNPERAFFVRITSAGILEYFQSSAGTAIDVRVITSAALPVDWAQIAIVIDPSLSGATNVVKIYINGTLVASTAPTDSGVYTLNALSSQKLTLGCHFNAASTPVDYYVGAINIFRIHNVAFSAADVSEIYNSGNPIDSYQSHTSSCIFATNIKNAAYSSGYTVPELVSGYSMTQTSAAAASTRTSHLDTFCNMNKISNPQIAYSNPAGWFSYDDQVGASFNLTSGIQFTLLHTGLSDPDRNSCEVLSEGSYDISTQELWVRWNDYTWEPNGTVGNISHGGFSIMNTVNDIANAIITHRSLTTAQGYYRTVVANSAGIQQEFESTIEKGKDVFLKISGTTVSFWYNNSGTLVQIGTDYTVDLGTTVRLKAHARDYNIYDAPTTFGIDSLRIYRSTPTDL